MYEIYTRGYMMQKEPVGTGLIYNTREKANRRMESMNKKLNVYYVVRVSGETCEGKRVVEGRCYEDCATDTADVTNVYENLSEVLYEEFRGKNVRVTIEVI